jgi:hypothetical protein
VPFVSRAQQRLMWMKARKGEIPIETAQEWQNATGDQELPEHVRRRKALVNKLRGEGSK